MLVNLHKDCKKCKAEKQRQKFILRDNDNRDDQLFSNKCKKDWKKTPFTFNKVFRPYTPCGDEYTPDSMTDFTGVYFCNFMDAGFAIDHLTRTHTLDPYVFYGCCDNASQAIESFVHYCERAAEYNFPVRGNHVIIISPMRRDRVYSFEEAMGTFRWHKNGGYVGKADIRSEYFLSEPDENLKLVYLFQVLRVA